MCRSTENEDACTNRCGRCSMLTGFHTILFVRYHKAFKRVNTERDDLDMGTVLAISSGHPEVNHTSRDDPALQLLQRTMLSE